MQHHGWRCQSMACLRKLGEVWVCGRKPDRMIGEPNSLRADCNAVQRRIVEVLLEISILQRSTVAEPRNFQSDIAVVDRRPHDWWRQERTIPSLRQQIQTGDMPRIHGLPLRGSVER